MRIGNLQRCCNPKVVWGQHIHIIKSSTGDRRTCGKMDKVRQRGFLDLGDNPDIETSMRTLKRPQDNESLTSVYKKARPPRRRPRPPPPARPPPPPAPRPPGLSSEGFLVLLFCQALGFAYEVHVQSITTAKRITRRIEAVRCRLRPPAIPPKPRTAATKRITRKMCPTKHCLSPENVSSDNCSCFH